MCVTWEHFPTFFDLFHRAFSQVTSDSDWPQAHSYSLFSFQNNQGGTLGIAWIGYSKAGPCASDKGKRTNLNEFLDDEMRTAEVILKSGFFVRLTKNPGPKKPRVFSKKKQKNKKKTKKNKNQQQQ